MELPAIKLPQIELPFDIPVLLHPPVDHFIIALPVIILILELVNVVFKKRAIGVTSFFLLILTVVAAAAAYLTGSVDGKEIYPLLSEAAQGELKEHKLLGTYLMLASVVVLLFKLLSSMINRGLMKALYLLILILFVVGILKQGKEGGELVYKHGANVEQVQTLENELDDLKEELEELEEKEKKETLVAVKEVEEVAPVIKVVEKPTAEVVEEKIAEVKENVEVLEEKTEAAVEVIPQTVPQAQIATH